MDGTLEKNQSLSELKGRVFAIPSVDDTLTKKGHSADAKAVGDALEKKVSTEDVVDNLTSAEGKKPLSANQGKILKDALDKINTSQAATVGYDNKASGLAAVNMQGAIDEVAGMIDDLSQEFDGMDYFPQTGGIVEGAVGVRNVNNGYGRMMKNHSSEADYGTQLEDITKDGKTAKISVSALLGLCTYTDPDGNIRDIHHEGTKPFGSYKGDGSAVTRTIDTKGIGRLITVYNPSYFSFVTPQGALVVTLSEGSIKWIDSSKIYFLNGTLGISTSNAAFNSADTDYYYQVI